MIHRYTLGLVALLTGCLVAPTGSTAPTHRSASDDPQIGYEPGMLELGTLRDGEGAWRLLIAAGAHTPGGVSSGSAARVAFTRTGEADRWGRLYTWKQFHDGITWIGGAQVGDETGALQAREIDELPVIPGAGTYTLKLDIGGNVVETSVAIVEVRQTSGELGLAVDPASYQTRAAMRFDRDAHGIDIGYPHEPRLWITLRSPMTRERTRADVLWYRGTEKIGQSSQEHRLGGIGIATPFETATRFWMWPKGVSLEEMTDGAYTAYIYQDGVYTTACTFDVAGGKIAGRAKSSAPLACTKTETSTDVKHHGAKLPFNPEDPARKRELVALYKSEETRKVLKDLIALRRAQGNARMSRGMAVDAEENAWTRGQAKRAAERYENASTDIKTLQKDVAKLNRRYTELVAKHGKE